MTAGKDTHVDLSSAHGSVAVCSRDGQILSISPKGAELLGRASLFLSAPPARRLPEELLEAIDAVPESQPVEWLSENGNVDLSIARTSLDELRWLLTMREIVDRQSTFSYQIYQSTQEVFSRIISSAAHDLRSPLSSMSFNIGVLRRRLYELPEQQVKRLLDEIAASCELQLKAINALIEDAAASSDVDLPLGRLFDRLAEMLRPLFRARKNTLKIDVDRELCVRGTALALEHIFVNLLQNSVQASRFAVTVEVRQTQVFVPPNGSGRGSVFIQVQDSGPGIPPEVRRRIFDPFYTTKAGGSGVGLSLAREAARQIGGDLKLVVNSAPGACFEVRLPMGARKKPRELAHD